MQSSSAILTWIAHPAGPFDTCTITLCGSPASRRRQLLAICTPFNVSCPFVSGVAACNLTGLVAQTTTYSVNSIATAANGDASKSGAQPSLSVPLFP